MQLTLPIIMLALGSSTAMAQTQTQPASRPVTPAPAYASAFSDYKPYKEPVLVSWRAANDQVGTTGAMSGHDMATMPSQPDDPHAGHDMSTMKQTRPKEAAPVRPTQPSGMDGADHAAHGSDGTKKPVQRKATE